jgi:hypothetical protein
MMDMSSIIDAGLVAGGVMAVVWMGTSMLSSDSTSVSTFSGDMESHADRNEHFTLRKAA